MPLQRRLPKRGFKSLTRARHYEVRLSALNNIPSDEIDLLILQAAGLVPSNALSAKIILSGEMTRKVTLQGLLVTAGAQKAIEAAGGVVKQPQEKTAE